MSKYLYNGVELSDIETVYTPELQKTHPYVLIFDYSGSLVYTNRLYCSTLPFLYISKGYIETSGEVLETCLVKSSDAWEEFEPYETYKQWLSAPIWSNHNVLNEDGTVYLAASEPIPVSSFTPDPISMTMGWIVGRRIASQRGKYVEPDEPDVPDVPDVPDGPSGVYDNTWPIEWDCRTDVSGNVPLTYEDGTIMGYKISSLSGDAASFEGTAYSIVKPKCVLNGYEFPALPEWDKTTHPYALVTMFTEAGVELSGGNIAQLYVTSNPFDATKADSAHYTSESNQYDYLLWHLTPVGWINRAQSSPRYASVGNRYPDDQTYNEFNYTVWSNHDIIEKNGNTVVFAASEYTTSSEKYTINGVLSEADYSIYAVDENVAMCTLGDVGLIICTVDGYQVEGVTAPEAGIYLMADIVGNDTSFSLFGPNTVPDEPDVPTGIYDDTEPLTWNSLAVTNNGAKFTYQGTPMVKISNLFGDAYDFNKYGILNIITGGMTFTATLQGTQNIEGCIGGVYAATVGTQTMQLLAISVPQAGTYAGIDIPEKGIYVTDYGALMPDDSIDFESTTGSGEVTDGIEITDSYIKWGGNTDGLEHVEVVLSGSVALHFDFYKVSDEVPSQYTEDYTKLVCYDHTGVRGELASGVNPWVISEENGVIAICLWYALVVLEEGATWQGVSFSPGVWFMKQKESLFRVTELHFET